jgi:hypothetical protein
MRGLKDASLSASERSAATCRRTFSMCSSRRASHAALRSIIDGDGAAAARGAGAGAAGAAPAASGERGTGGSVAARREAAAAMSAAKSVALAIVTRSQPAAV